MGGRTVRCLVILFIALQSPLVGQTESEEVQLLLDKQVKAWNGGDINGFMAGYWESDSLLFTSSGNILRGWKTLREKYRESYTKEGRMGFLKFTDVDIQLLSPETAWVFGAWELRRENDRRQGVFTLILKKFPSGWKIIHDHTSLSQ